MTITAPPPVAPPRPIPDPAGAAAVVVRERHWWLPRRVRLVDAGFTATAGALALAGLAPSFDGYQFLVVGLLGLLLGTAAGIYVVHLRWPRALSPVAAVAVFYLLGGVLCLREVSAIWPVPHTWRLLTDQLVFGWKDLLTTLPPVDGRGPLLTLPWALGLLAGSGAMAATSWKPPDRAGCEPSRRPPCSLRCGRW
ncbi:MAG: hypothetical protein QM714_09180 [Nocardioides sp.]|uniref:hypothetical protein n=1 Tax=Nocardioides sp. TaxID=35761 RepID=UPI0039E616DB